MRAPISRAIAAWVSAAVMGVAWPTAAGDRQNSLTEVAALGQRYEAILDARFDRAEADLRHGCAPAPAAACRVLEAVALWWRIQLEPESVTHDQAFADRVARAIEATEAWVAREPRRAEAWFYLGGAYAARVPWRALRGQTLAAARDGKRVKDALERATALDPQLDDAYFGIGLYHYYADVAPVGVKLLRWLMLLPGGNRALGLREMERARSRGALLRGEADYQLHLLYLWYEHEPGKALALLEGLRQRYPSNPLFVQRIAEVQDVYLHDAAASLAAYRVLLSAALERRVNFPELAEVRARLGVADQLDALFETDQALDELATVIRAKPSSPYSALARAHLRFARASDRLGYRDQAVAAYRAALATAPRDDPFKVRPAARAGLRHTPDPHTAEAYRLSLEGWRLIERHQLPAAAVTIRRAMAIDPDDVPTRFRHGRLLQTQGEEARAIAEFEWIIRRRVDVPPTILASTYLEAGRLVERAGDVRRAIEMYRSAAAIVAADDATRQTATRSLERLRAAPSSGRVRPDR